MQFLFTTLLRVIRALVAAMLLASVVLICANAFGRYVLLSPVIWAEEVLGYALVWIVYLGAVLVTWDSGHLRMDLLSRALPAPLRRGAEIFSTLVFAAASGLVVWQAIPTIQQFGHRSQIAGLPMDVLHAVIPVSFALMIACVVLRALKPPESHDQGKESKKPTSGGAPL